MILYRLACEQGHEFESWFPGSDAFESQRDRGLVACAFCGSAKVDRALMAPALASDKPKDDAPLSTPGSEAEVALANLRRKVEAESDYVGAEFADEARRIHLGEAEARGIWGEANPADAKALHEEGIPVAPLPFMRRLDG
ncbi:MAG: DUF1178 family protein [Pseudomonadota bacterium]